MKTIQYIIFIVSFTSVLFVKGQQDMTIYHMHKIPQSNYSNPALFPEPKWHIGVPMLSSIYLEGGHTGFNSFHVLTNTNDDSVSIDLENMINKMGKYNYVNMNFAYEFLSFGFRLKDKHYFNFSLSNKMYATLSYPRDLFDFVYQGNGAFFDETLKFDRMGINAAHYNELMIGWATHYDDLWDFGVHVKVLQGLSNIYMKKSDVTLLTEEEHFFITTSSNIDMYASLPDPVWAENDSIRETMEYSFGDYIGNFSNMGAAIDLGASYKWSDKLTMGMSLIDLGFFRWKSGARNLKSNNPGGSFTFEGIDITDFISQQDTTGAESRLDNLLDSISDIFMIDTLETAYTSFMNTKLFLSGVYKLTDKDVVTGLVRLQYFSRTIHTAITLGYIRKFGNILSLSVNYTAANRKYFNMGLGMAANLGPVQLYITTDNLISPFVWNKYTWTETIENESTGIDEYESHDLTIPRNTKFFNLHFGLNLVFGYKPPKESAPIFQ